MKYVYKDAMATLVIALCLFTLFYFFGMFKYDATSTAFLTVLLVGASEIVTSACTLLWIGVVYFYRSVTNKHPIDDDEDN